MHFPRIYVKFEIIKNFLINLVLKNMLIAYHHVNSPQSIATFMAKSLGSSHGLEQYGYLNYYHALPKYYV